MSCCDARFLGQACGCDAEREQDEREWQRRKKEIAAREDWIRADERRLIAAFIRTAPRAGGALISVDSSGDIARLADDIERGEHAKGDG
jgi:hypothetical protein